MNRTVRALLITLTGVALALTITPHAEAHTAERARPHWEAKVTVVDHTAGTWPNVGQVAQAWARSRYVAARVATACKVGTYCVTVEAGEYGDTGWYGATSATGQASALIQLNLSYTSDPAQQSAVMCHELGHALGIAHPDETDPAGRVGCIAGTGGEAPGPVALPSYADMAQVRAIGRGDTPSVQGTPQGWGALYALELCGKYRR